MLKVHTIYLLARWSETVGIQREQNVNSPPLLIFVRFGLSVVSDESSHKRKAPGHQRHFTYGGETRPHFTVASFLPMAYSSRPTSMLPGAPGGSSMRPPSSQSQQSSALSARIAAKKAELENLRQLRDLSGTLALQMQALENKVSTLKDGTEGCPSYPLFREWSLTHHCVSCGIRAIELG